MPKILNIIFTTNTTLARKIKQCDLALLWNKNPNFFLMSNMSKTCEGDSNADLERHQNRKSVPDRHQSDADPQHFIYLRYIGVLIATFDLPIHAFHFAINNLKCFPIERNNCTQCCGSMTFWGGSGSADPCLRILIRIRIRILETNTSIFVIDLQDASKKLYF